MKKRELLRAGRKAQAKRNTAPVVVMRREARQNRVLDSASPNTTNATATLVGVVINPTIFEIIKNILDMRAFPAARFRRSKMTGSSTPYHKPRHKIVVAAGEPAGNKRDLMVHGENGQ